MSSKKYKKDVPFTKDCEAPRPQARAFRARRGEHNASKENIFLVVPLNLPEAVQESGESIEREYFRSFRIAVFDRQRS
jgi:hypothetical protein